jgi:hypothetical protein
MGGRESLQQCRIADRWRLQGFNFYYLSALPTNRWQAAAES